MNVRIEESWKAALYHEFEQDYFAQIRQNLLAMQRAGMITYPPNKLIFNAFNSTPFQSVRVVILGQDPYHKPGQAMGLSFSVPRGVPIPPSLRNIYKELERSIPNFHAPTHGDLSSWSAQGVFLLNAVLTVERGKAAAHAALGWQHFTDAVIRCLSEQRRGLIFMLWGTFAKSKAALIDRQHHHILTAVHPSPLANSRPGGGFIGCNHFARANEILSAAGEKPIDWRLPD